MTVGEAFKHSLGGGEKESIYACYVLERLRRINFATASQSAITSHARHCPH